MISASSSAASAAGVGGETVGAVPAAQRAPNPNAQITTTTPLTARRGFLPDQKRVSVFIVCAALLFQCGRDVNVNHLAQYRQRYRAGTQQEVMKSLHRKLRTEGLLGARSLRENFEFPNFIRASLTRHYDVAL